MLTTAMDNAGRIRIKPPSATSVSRSVPQLPTDLDSRNLATDQKADGLRTALAMAQPVFLARGFLILPGGGQLEWKPHLSRSLKGMIVLVSTEVVVLIAGLGGSLLGVVGSLGGVWLRSRYDYQRDENQAIRTETAAQAERRLDAYANLLVAAGNVLGTYQRLPGLLPPTFDDRAAQEANQRMSSLAAELHRASAIVALTGSETGREEGKRLYLAARGLAATRVKWEGKWSLSTSGNDLGLDRAIEGYKAALVPETTGLPGPRAIETGRNHGETGARADEAQDGSAAVQRPVGPSTGDSL
jgi:hypothetical protein